jgi:homoserine O-acetyltransferase
MTLSGKESVHEFGPFEFETGETISQLRIACVSYGELSPAKDNVLLVLPGTSNTRHSALGYVGPGQAYDTNRFHVVCIDAIGLGGSSQPADGLGGEFPAYGIRDLVRAHRLLVACLGLADAPIAAIAGASMGAFQALEWAIHYPESVLAAILMVPAASAGGVVRTVNRQMREIVALDPLWNGGKYPSAPIAGLNAAGRHFYPWALTDEYLEAIEPDVLSAEIDAAGRRFAEFDAWNLIRRYGCSSRHDAAAPFGGDMTLALAEVSARVLVLPCKQDRLLGLRSAREIAQGLRHAEYAEIDSPKGHLAWRPVAGSAETMAMTRHVRSFLMS